VFPTFLTLYSVDFEDNVVWYIDRDGNLGLFTNILQLNIDQFFQYLYIMDEKTNLQITEN
jgi:uncharacterized protein YrzB (UPF0473 family)